MTNKPLIGFMQGRLIDAPDNEDLDWFPFRSWEKEFELANKLNLSTIELVLDRGLNKKNPIWSLRERIKIKRLLNKYNLENYSCCINFIIDHPLFEEDIYTSTLEAINYLDEIDVKYVILPFFQESTLENEFVVDSLKKISKEVEKKGIQLLVESDLGSNELSKLLSTPPLRKVGVVYDIGNATFNRNCIIEDWNILKDRIRHVHIKDKDSQGKNIFLGEGLVNFKEFFDILQRNEYKGKLVFETSRGAEALKTAKRNLNFINRFLKNFDSTNTNGKEIYG